MQSLMGLRKSLDFLLRAEGSYFWGSVMQRSDLVQVRNAGGLN